MVDAVRQFEKDNLKMYEDRAVQLIDTVLTWTKRSFKVTNFERFFLFSWNLLLVADCFQVDGSFLLDQFRTEFPLAG